MKQCKHCGSNQFIAKITYGAIIEFDKHNEALVKQQGSKFNYTVMQCNNCKTENPVILEDFICSACNSITTQEEIEKYKGVCAICKAKQDNPELFELSPEQLIRQMLEVQAENARLKLGTTAIQEAPSVARESAVVNSTTINSSVPTNPLLNERSSEPDSCIKVSVNKPQEVMILENDLLALEEEYDDEWSPQKKAGYTKRKNNIIAKIDKLMKNIINEDEQASQDSSAKESIETQPSPPNLPEDFENDNPF